MNFSESHSKYDGDEVAKKETCSAIFYYVKIGFLMLMGLQYINKLPLLRENQLFISLAR